MTGLGGHNCAGVLLSPWWVVSTGLCAQTDDDLDHDHFQVVAGEWNLAGDDGTEQVRHVETVYTHPYFSAEQGGDIALIKLNSSLELGQFVAPVSLAQFGSSYEGSRCVEAGWSTLSGHVKLQYGEVMLSTQEECEADPNAGPHAWATMCGGEEDTGTAVMCPGYTGSPLVCPEGEEMVLAGLQSFTYSCGTQGGPSVYTNISALADWVEYIISKHSA